MRPTYRYLNGEKRTKSYTVLRTHVCGVLLLTSYN